MNANARWQDMVSENLASSSIPGARSRNVSFSSVQAGSQFVIPSANTAINFQPGELRTTGNPLDFALEGKGFFEVQLPNGEHAFTRDGEFHLSAQGQLVTKQGYTVLGDGGPLQFDPSNSHALAISATGEVSQGSELRGKLKVVEFEKPQALSQVGGGLYTPGQSSQLPTPAKASSVRQGFLEGSNVSPVKEMAGLIGTMRAFEASQRVLQMHDERMGRAISELGNPN